MTFIAILAFVFFLFRLLIFFRTFPSLYYVCLLSGVERDELLMVLTVSRNTRYYWWISGSPRQTINITDYRQLEVSFRLIQVDVDNM